MLKLKQNELKLVPFELYKSLDEAELVKQAEEHQLNLLQQWLLPQILAYFGTWQVVPHKSTGFLDPKATARQNITTDWELGLWRVCTQLKRGLLVKTQSSELGRHYSQLVPLILAGLKQHRGIKYKQWSSAGLASLVHQELVEVMTYEGECLNLGSEELLEIREMGLTIRSGARAGQLHKPQSLWKLSGLQATSFYGTPPLLATVLCQTWVAHPSLRTHLMVLDPRDWDRMPKPLVSDGVFDLGSTEKTNVKMPQPGVKLPWDL